MANSASWNNVYKRINAKRKEAKLTWNQLAAKAGIMANSASWNNVYKRINAKRKEAKLTWNQLAAKAGIKVGTWMTGLPISHPTEEEVHKIAAVPEMNTTYAYLRYGITDLSELE